MTEGKYFTSSIFIIFIIALVLSLASLFLPYDPIIHNQICINNPILYCYSGSILQLLSLFFAFVIFMIMISYWLVRANNNSSINDSFGIFNYPIFFGMLLVTVCHIIDFILINDLNHPFDTAAKKEGFWALFVSTIFFTLSTIMIGFQLFLKK
jgi:hypothetical protein